MAAASYSAFVDVASAARKMIVPQPPSFQMSCGDDQRLEDVRVAHDVDGVRHRARPAAVEQAGAAEHLLEQRDDEHPGEEVRQIDHALHEPCGPAADHAVQQQGERERQREEEDELEA